MVSNRNTRVSLWINNNIHKHTESCVCMIFRVRVYMCLPIAVMENHELFTKTAARLLQTTSHDDDDDDGYVRSTETLTTHQRNNLKPIYI